MEGVLGLKRLDLVIGGGERLRGLRMELRNKFLVYIASQEHYLINPIIQQIWLYFMADLILFHN